MAAAAVKLTAGRFSVAAEANVMLLLTAEFNHKFKSLSLRCLSDHLTRSVI